MLQARVDHLLDAVQFVAPEVADVVGALVNRVETPVHTLESSVSPEYEDSDQTGLCGVPSLAADLVPADPHATKADEHRTAGTDEGYAYPVVHQLFPLGAFFFAFAQRVAPALAAISLRRSGVKLSARFFAIATALGSFFFFSIPAPILPQALSYARISQLCLR